MSDEFRYDVFLCHSSKDKANRTVARLENGSQSGEGRARILVVASRLDADKIRPFGPLRQRPFQDSEGLSLVF